jgi:hypothetical protein
VSDEELAATDAERLRSLKHFGPPKAFCPTLRLSPDRAATATNARLGWPAPADVADAIDDAEYDLALLQELSAMGGGIQARHDTPSVNPHLARALRNRYQRWSKTWTS